MMYASRRISLKRSLFIRLTVFHTFACLCTCNDMSKRILEPPYRLSFHFNDTAGSLVNYGPSGTASGGKFYRTLTIHNGTLFAGGKSHMFSASPGNLNTLANITVDPDVPDMGCEFCDGNYIRIIQPIYDDTLLECGTNTNQPYCQLRSTETLERLGGPYRFSGDLITPSHRHQNYSWLLLNDTESGNYRFFAGTHLVNSFGSLGEPAIVRADITGNSMQIGFDIDLKTKDNPNTILNGPQFVGDPIEFKDHIFFFFREFASEHINGGRIMYSRVSIICKDELGGKPFSTYTDKELVTFVKARLDCSIPGEKPYFYNEIQDVYQSKTDPLVVYAIFATSGPTGAVSSAVCAYRLDVIRNMFYGSQFKAQKNDRELWTKVSYEPVTERPATCPNTTLYSDREYLAILDRAQLLSNLVLSRLHYDLFAEGVGPLLVANGEQFSQIVVDEDVMGSSIDVMFIGTENGTVLKAYLNQMRTEARIVEEISLDAGGSKSPVLTMVASSDEEAIFVGTDVGVYKLPFQHCRDYMTCRECLGANDPYCTWTNDGSCTMSSRDPAQPMPNCTNDPDDRIIILRSPPRQLHVPNRPVNLDLLAEARVGSNLRLTGVNCEPCATLPFTQHRSTCSQRELLVVQLHEAYNDTLGNCRCFVNLETDGGVNATVDFTLNTDTSDETNLRENLVKVEKFDLNVARYKYELEEWKNRVLELCGGDARSCKETSTSRQKLNETSEEQVHSDL